MPKIHSKKVFALPGALALALMACTPATPPGATATATYNDQSTAKVIQLDKPKRLITLQTPGGQVATIKATDAVRNFDQISVGDTVKVDYQERVDILVRGSNATPISGVIVHAGAARANKGQEPGGAVAVTAKRSVEIVSVDRTSHTVTFRETDGSLDSFVVQNPANYALADGLRPGTIVDVTESAALAIGVQKM